MTTYRRRPDLHAAEMDGELVMLDTSQGAYFGLNEVGAVLWQLLETERTLDELGAQLVVEFEIDLDAARRDAETFVTGLVEHRLVTVR